MFRPTIPGIRTWQILCWKTLLRYPLTTRIWTTGCYGTIHQERTSHGSTRVERTFQQRNNSWKSFMVGSLIALMETS
jgi:hypothetical protein